MHDITIQKNLAFELIGAVERYIFTSEVVEQAADMGYKLLDKLEAWVCQVDTGISPFLKNDLHFVRILGAPRWAFLGLICEKELTTAGEFLNEFKLLDAREFLRSYLRVFSYEWDGHSPIDYKNLELQMLERLDKEQVIQILEIIRYPEEMKARVYQAYAAFYEHFVAPHEPEVARYLEDKIAEHRRLYAENPELFTRMFLLSDGENWRKLEQSAIQIYASYYFELAVELKILESRRIFIYGVTLEQRYEREKRAERQKYLFKVLADEKRVEILKLLSEREWYGNELAKHFGLTTATMSYHLSKLMDLEVIAATEGEQNRFYYRLQKERLRTLFLDVVQDILGDQE